MMRGCMVCVTIALTIAAVALAQDAPVTQASQPGTTIPAGVPLRVALQRRVVIKHPGEAIQGQLVEPVYVFDRVVLPAGSVVEGHVAEIGGVPARAGSRRSSPATLHRPGMFARCLTASC
jgi:hypothetical protein